MCFYLQYYKRSGFLICANFRYFPQKKRKRGPGNEVGEIQDGGSNDVLITFRVLN